MISRSPATALMTLVIAAFWLLVSLPAIAQSRQYTLTAPDGVTLAVQETGNPDGKPILFIHGLLGSRLNWENQLKNPALQRYRLVTYDLRGHGLSGKPTDMAAYTEGQRWGDDLDTVIHALDLQKPVLVGWSLGGAVMTNYLAAHGDDEIAGAVYVDGVVELKPDQIQPHPGVYRDMVSTDLKTHLDAERTFLELCFHQLPDTTTFDRLVANAALASWDMQRSVQSMSIPAAKGLGEARVPLLFISGAQDALLKAEPTIARARQINPGLKSVLYTDSGHAPFLEESERFNRDLLDFMAVTGAAQAD
ncbi:alpha/beta fold hydrolase [Kushneria phyllosphaerae]|uniref:Arylesterase n=1 Tax=Kushneria phyllosphaerae TaxID=2100822 RepID=A0A2R8CLS5_9GAMM|nr:alpha/beta hydrolase [Kushneria phyllosphaerae]SPJ33773.1 Arylesterase [Kushneria phyllosphaerae]